MTGRATSPSLSFPGKRRPGHATSRRGTPSPPARAAGCTAPSPLHRLSVVRPQTWPSRSPSRCAHRSRRRPTPPPGQGLARRLLPDSSYDHAGRVEPPVRPALSGSPPRPDCLALPRRPDPATSTDGSVCDLPRRRPDRGDPRRRHRLPRAVTARCLRPATQPIVHGNAVHRPAARSRPHAQRRQMRQGGGTRRALRSGRGVPATPPPGRVSRGTAPARRPLGRPHAAVHHLGQGSVPACQGHAGDPLTPQCGSAELSPVRPAGPPAGRRRSRCRPTAGPGRREPPAPIPPPRRASSGPGARSATPPRPATRPA